MKEPVTLKGEVKPEQVSSIDGEEVMVQPVIAEPLAEALKGIETVVLFVRVTVPSVGVDGAVGADATVLVITLFVPPTATNVALPQAILCQVEADAAVPSVQSTPFWLDITCPSLETATKESFPKTTAFHKFCGTCDEVALIQLAAVCGALAL